MDKDGSSVAGDDVLSEFNRLMGIRYRIRNLEYKRFGPRDNTAGSSQLETAVAAIKRRLPPAIAGRMDVPADRKKHTKAAFEALRELALDELWRSIEALAAEAKEGPGTTVAACDAEYRALDAGIAAEEQLIRAAGARIAEIRAQQTAVCRRKQRVVDYEEFRAAFERARAASKQ
jgi:hypothetical protein